MINFSVRLKFLLQTKGISIKDFAAQVGMSEIGLHNAIKNNSTKLETIQTMAEELEVPVSYFFKTDEELAKDNRVRNYDKISADLSVYKDLFLTALDNGTESWRFFSMSMPEVHNEAYTSRWNNSIAEIKQKLDIIQTMIIEAITEHKSIPDKKMFETVLKLVPREELESFKKVNKTKLIHPGREKLKSKNPS